MRSFYIAALILFSFIHCAQQYPQRVTTGTATVGSSAISSGAIVAKTYKVIYPIFDFGADSSSGLFIFSARQKEEGGSQYPSRGFIGTINMSGDSVNWLFESNYYELSLPGKNLFFSNEQKTTKYDKLHGFVDLNFPSRVLCAFPSFDKALLYTNTEKNILSGVNISDGAVVWTSPLPGRENWVDLIRTPDSLLLVAAGGLHAIDPKTGVQWSYSLTTASKITKALSASLVNKNSAIRNLSTVIKTSDDETNVTELSSNILTDKATTFFAAKEKMIAVGTDGKLLWELDLKAYPVSKMFLAKRGSSVILVNLGLAKYADNYVTYGNPFVLTIDPQTGKIKSQTNLNGAINLMDFSVANKFLIFVGKNTLLEIEGNSGQVDTLQMLNPLQHGIFSEFIDGNRYYTEKEGFYVSLNFINDNLMYFRADNNKIYAIDKKGISYAYHFTEIYKLEKKFGDKMILANEEKSLIVSSNFDLLCTIDLIDKPVVLGKRIFFVGERIIYSLSMDEIK